MKDQTRRHEAEEARILARHLTESAAKVKISAEGA